jgi:hypothetical protein
MWPCSGILHCVATYYKLVSCSADFQRSIWRWHNPHKCWFIYGLHNAITQKMATLKDVSPNMDFWNKINWVEIMVSSFQILSSSSFNNHPKIQHHFAYILTKPSNRPDHCEIISTEWIKMRSRCFPILSLSLRMESDLAPKTFRSVQNNLIVDWVYKCSSKNHKENSSELSIRPALNFTVLSKKTAIFWTTLESQPILILHYQPQIKTKTHMNKITNMIFCNDFLKYDIV